MAGIGRAVLTIHTQQRMQDERLLREETGRYSVYPPVYSAAEELSEQATEPPLEQRIYESISRSSAGWVFQFATY